MTYSIEIDATKVEEQISLLLNKVLEVELRRRYSATNEEISKGIKDLIYANKDEIIEKVVDRAAAEIVRKGMPRLMKKMMEVGE